MPYQDFVKRLQGQPQSLTLPEYDLPTQIEPMVDPHQAAVEKIFGRTKPNFAIDVPDDWNVEEQKPATTDTPPKYRKLSDLLPKKTKSRIQRPQKRTGTEAGTVTARNPLTDTAFDRPRPTYDMGFRGPSQAEQMAERAITSSRRSSPELEKREADVAEAMSVRRLEQGSVAKMGDGVTRRLPRPKEPSYDERQRRAKRDAAKEQLRIQFEEMNPIQRYGLRAARGIMGDRLDPEAEAEVFAPVGQLEDSMNRLAGKAVTGLTSIPEGFARIADRQLNRGDLATAEALETMLANHPEWSEQEKAQVTGRIQQIYGGLSKVGDRFEGLSKFGEKAAQTVTPVELGREYSINPLNPDFWQVTMPEAAGSMLPFMAAGGVGRALAVAPELVAGAAGMAMEVPQGYKEARERGATPEQLARTVDTGMFAGGLESLGAESLLGKIGMTGKSIPGHIAKEAGQEFGQEAAQSVVGDVGAKYYSQHKPELTAGQITMNALQNAVPALFLGAGGGVLGVGGRDRGQKPNLRQASEQIEELAVTQPDNPVVQVIAQAGIDPTTVAKADERAVEQLSIRLEAMAKMESQIQQLQGQQGIAQQQLLNAQDAQRMGRVPSQVDQAASQTLPVVEQQIAEAEAQKTAIVEDLAQNVSPLFKNLAKAIGKSDVQPIGDVAEDEQANLLSEVRKAGGISAGEGTVEKGELDRLGIKESGTTGVIRREGGQSADRMREQMASEGLTEAETPQQFIEELEALAKREKTEAESYRDYERSQMTEQELADSDKLDSLLEDRANPFTKAYRALDNPKTIYNNKLAKDYVNAATEAGFSDDFIERSLVEFQRQRGIGSSRRDVTTEEGSETVEPGRSMKSEDESAALRRSIARSEEREHVAPSPGMGLVSMSPYKVLEANKKDLLKRLYDINLNSNEAKTGINELRDWARENNIAQKHVDAHISDIQNWHKTHGIPKNPDQPSVTRKIALNRQEEAPQPARTEAAPVSTGFTPEQRQLLGRDPGTLLDSEFDEYMGQLENLQNLSVRGQEFGGFDIKESERKGLVAKLIETRAERKKRVKAKRLPALTAPHTKKTDTKAELGEQLVEQAAERETIDVPRETANVPQAEAVQATRQERLRNLIENRGFTKLTTDHNDNPVLESSGSKASRERIWPGDLDFVKQILTEREKSQTQASETANNRAEAEKSKSELEDISSNLRPLPKRNEIKRIEGALHSLSDVERVGELDFELWESEADGGMTMITRDAVTGEAVPGSIISDTNADQAKRRFVTKIENARQASGERHDEQTATAKPAVRGEPAREAVAEPGEVGDVRDAATAFPDTRSGRIAERLVNGESFDWSKKRWGVRAGTEDAKRFEEDVELAGVMAARAIVAKGLSAEKTYAEIRSIYGRLPNFNTRTSESVRDQAYSTPLPIAYVASRLAGITKDTTVYEPTGGNGALVMEASPDNTTINDLNSQRVENLRQQGFEANVADATKVSLGAKVDVVIANPPFGVVKEGGQSKQFNTPFGKTTEIDHAIAFQALEAMAPDGRAVLIVGGVHRMAKTQEARSDAYNQAAKRRFYSHLYDNYNVVDHFTIDGQMYAKQGAAWPVDVIVIDGKGKSARKYPAVSVPEIVRSYEELGNKIPEGKVLESTERQQSVGRGEAVSGQSGVRSGRLPGFDSDEIAGDAGTGRKPKSSTGGRAKQPTTSQRSSGERLEPVDIRSSVQESAEPATANRAKLEGKTAKTGSVSPETTVRENKPASVGERTDSGVGRTSELDAMFEEEFADMFGETQPISQTPNEQYNEALDKFRKSSSRFSEAQKKYRAQEIGDNEFLAEKAKFDIADKAMDKAEDQFKQSPRPKKTKPNLKQSADALMDLFGDKPAVGPPASRRSPGFDESLYQKAKPQFETALSTFEGLDDRAAIRELLNYLKSNYGERAEAAIYRMKPYIIQFVEDRTTAVETKAEPQEKQIISEKSELSHAAYEPLSASRSLGVAVPKNMSGAVKQALESFEERHGSPDAYVADKLGYKPEEVEKYFAAEQVDAIALAIDNIEQGKGFITGDQTGQGKGRQVAAIIRYAIKNGKTPVFVTQKPALYADMIRDLKDIGMENVRPLITNSGEAIPLNDAATEWMHAVVDAKANGQKAPSMPSDAKVFRAKPDHVATLEQVGMSGKLKGYDVVFTTYDQMNPMGGLFSKERHAAVSSAVRGGVLIMDESHTAGGVAVETRGKPTPSRSKFFRGLVKAAGSVFYSSATYAKRPDVMDLYSKTDLGMLGQTGSALTELFNRGGVALQQVVASKLAEAGQYLRRERTFDGITYSPEVVEVSKKHAENVSTAMRKIVGFDNAKRAAIRDLKEAVKSEAALASEDGSIGSAGVDSSNFTSLMHNVIDQMLLGLKADQAAAQAIKAIQNGERPVLTVSNTMESFLKDAGLSPGNAVDLTFKDVLMRYLVRSRDVTIKDRNGKKIRRPLTDDELGVKGLNAFHAVQDFINESDFGEIPISPIDRVRELIEKAGYKVDEITGRGTRVDSTGKIPILRARSAQDTKVAGRRRVIGDFNNGRIDALILNQAGSTGISLHASPAGGKDVKPRHMIIWQAEKNIDTHMQMLGRINRTGQVTLPRYTQMIADVPAEKRPAAVLLKKMASLSANTTASRKSAVQTEGVTDFINELGDEVAARMLTQDAELSTKLGDPLEWDGPELSKDGAARRVSGRIPLLTLAEQQEVYERIESEYADFLAQKEAMGENPLEARTEDFRAETISREILTEGIPGSPFSEPAFIEKMKIRRTVKPYTSAEVSNMVRENLGLADDANDGQVRNAAHVKMDGFQQQNRTDFERFSEDLATIHQTEGGGNRFENAVYQGLLQRARTVEDAWATVARVIAPGSMVTVNTDGGSVSGVVLDVAKRGKPKNPYALGSWVVRLAVLDGRELRLSFNEMIEKGGLLKVGQSPNVNRLNPETGMFESRPMLPEFDASQGTKKQTRYMVTGNIVSGYAKLPKGQILNYTDADGNVKQGVLLPSNFDAAKTLAEMPVELSTASQVIDFFDLVPRGSVSDAKQEITIMPVKYGTDLEIRVLSSKAVGGKYYQDTRSPQDLVRITGQFVKQGGLMRVTIDRAKLPEVMDWLKEQGTVLQASHKDEAKTVLAKGRIAPPASLGLPKKMSAQKQVELMKLSLEENEQALEKAYEKLIDLEDEIVDVETDIETRKAEKWTIDESDSDFEAPLPTRAGLAAQLKTLRNEKNRLDRLVNRLDNEVFDLRIEIDEAEYDLGAEKHDGRHLPPASRRPHVFKPGQSSGKNVYDVTVDVFSLKTGKNDSKLIKVSADSRPEARQRAQEQASRSYPSTLYVVKAFVAERQSDAQRYADQAEFRRAKITATQKATEAINKMPMPPLRQELRAAAAQAKEDGLPEIAQVLYEASYVAHKATRGKQIIEILDSYDDAVSYLEGELGDVLRTIPHDLDEFRKALAPPALRQNVIQAERRADGSVPMREVYTARDLAQNAKATYRRAANRPGTIVLNDWGSELVNKALYDLYDVKVTEGNFTISPDEAGKLSEYLRETATENYDTNQKVALTEFAGSIDRAIRDAKQNRHDVAVVTRQTGETLSKLKTKIRHEGIHLAQSKIASDLASLTDTGWLDSQSHAEQIKGHLAERGYGIESHAFEAAAFVASGDYARFGMSSAEANRFLENYFDAIVEKHGKAALDKFGALHPDLQQSLERAKNETQVGQSEEERRTEGTRSLGQRGNERERASRQIGDGRQRISEGQPATSRRQAAGPASELANPMDVLLHHETIIKSRGTRGARMYVNDHARAILGASLTEVFDQDYSNVNAINLSREEVSKVAKYLETESKELTGDYKTGAERFVADLRELLAQDKTQRTFNIVDVTPFEQRYQSGFRPDAERAAEQFKGDIREEGFHWSQREVSGQSVALVGSSWAQSSKGFGKYRKALIALGYPDDAEVLAAETAAKIAAGKFDDLGIRTEADHEQAQNWLASYFERVAGRHGIEALDKFDRLLPKAKAAKEKGELSVKERLRQRIEEDQAKAGGTNRPRAPGSESGRVRATDERESKDGAQEVRRRSADEPFEEGAKAGPQLPIGEWGNKENVRMAGEPSPSPGAGQGGAGKPPKGPGKLFDEGGPSEGWSAPFDREPEQQAMFDEKGLPRKDWGKFWTNVADVVNIPKALRASGDLSAMLRQAFYLTVPPTRWAKAARSLRASTKALVSTRQFNQFYKNLKKHPAYNDAIAAGLYFSGNNPLSGAEEQFGSRFAGKIPWAKYSEQAFKVYLDSIRIETFALYHRTANRQIKGTAERFESHQAAAGWINTSSGRGDYRDKFGVWYQEKAAPLLNVFGWAPGLVYSRFQMINPLTYAKNVKDAQHRVVFVKQMSELFQTAAVLTTTGALAIAAGATISSDPDEADFLKLRFGTTRYDVLAGVQQVARLAIQLGEWIRSRAVEDDSAKLKKVSNETTMKILRFGRSKLAPVPAFFVDWLNDWKKITGEVHRPGAFWGKAKEGEYALSSAELAQDPVFSQVLPLIFSSTVEAYVKGYTADENQKSAVNGLIRAGYVAPFEFVGLGVQDYDRPEYSKGIRQTLAEYELDPGFLDRKPEEDERTYQKRVKAHIREQERVVNRFASDPNMIGQPKKRANILLRSEISKEGIERLSKLKEEDIEDDRMVRAWIQVGVERMKADPVFQQMSEMEQKHAIQSYYGRMNKYKAQPKNSKHGYQSPDVVDENILQRKIKEAIKAQQSN